MHLVDNNYYSFIAFVGLHIGHDFENAHAKGKRERKESVLSCEFTRHI